MKTRTKKNDFQLAFYRRQVSRVCQIGSGNENFLPDGLQLRVNYNRIIMRSPSRLPENCVGCDSCRYKGRKKHIVFKSNKKTLLKVRFGSENLGSTDASQMMLV
jgi:hypothetical protein